MERIQLAIGRLLLIGVLVSFIIILIGGILYLLNHGTDIIHYQAFHGEPQLYKSIPDILLDAFTLSPLALIQLGLLILVIVQILRVALTTWLFIQIRDNYFVYISLFILFILVYSLIWRF
jgi:uncharacterized membrane protein